MNIAALMALYLSVAAASVPLPFTITATEDDSAAFPGAPRIESASFGQWNGRWVFIGGRMAGYHSMGGTSADFPRMDANREVWVVDTTVRPARTFHVSLEHCSGELAAVADEWMATGQLSYQDGASLYIAGGYGRDSSGKWVTYPVISKIDLPRLIEGVLQGKLASDSISFARSPFVQSAGGELLKLNDGYFYLAMGHVFMGTYTAFEGQGEHNSAPVSQQYLNEIRKLTISSGEHGALTVALVGRFRDEHEFHRRDLNVTKVLSPAGEGLAAYGGVFTPDTQLSYSKPVYLFPNSRPVVDSTFEQKMNAYRCAKLLLYDQSTGTMYTTFFGGISRFLWDPATNEFRENTKTGSKSSGNYLDGLQWSDQISTVRKDFAPGRESTSETVQQCALPAFIGTEAQFIPAPGLTHASAGTDILDLASLRGKTTLAGYIYGGIRAYPFRFPYNKTATPYNAGTVPTKPSELILKVYLTVNQN